MKYLLILSQPKLLLNMCLSSTSKVMTVEMPELISTCRLGIRLQFQCQSQKQSKFMMLRSMACSHCNQWHNSNDRHESESSSSVSSALIVLFTQSHKTLFLFFFFNLLDQRYLQSLTSLRSRFITEVSIMCHCINITTATETVVNQKSLPLNDPSQFGS